VQLVGHYYADIIKLKNQ